MAVTYEAIATYTVSSSVATITLSSIPQTYTDLVLVAALTASDNPATVIIRFNNDSANNYSQITMAGASYGATTEKETNQGRINISATAGAPSASPALFNASLLNYSNTTTNKTLLSRWSNGSTTGQSAQAVVGLYRSTSQISRIDLFAFSSTFTNGSVFTIYGIKAA